MAKNLPYPPSPASEAMSCYEGMLPSGRDACLPAGRRRVTLSYFIAGPLVQMLSSDFNWPPAVTY
jgi:hypothetical protein